MKTHHVSVTKHAPAPTTGPHATGSKGAMSYGSTPKGGAGAKMGGGSMQPWRISRQNPKATHRGD